MVTASPTPHCIHVQPKHTTHFAPNPTGNSKHETNREKKVTKVDVQLWAEQLSVAQHEVTKVDVQLLAEQDGECEAMGLEPHPIAGVQCVRNQQMPHTVKRGSQEHSQAIVVAQAKLVARKAACDRNAQEVLATARQKTKDLQDIRQKTKDLQDFNDELEAKRDKANEIKQRIKKKEPQVKQPNYERGGSASSSSLFTVARPSAARAPQYVYMHVKTAKRTKTCEVD